MHKDSDHRGPSSRGPCAMVSHAVGCRLWPAVTVRALRWDPTPQDLILQPPLRPRFEATAKRFFAAHPKVFSELFPWLLAGSSPAPTRDRGARAPWLLLLLQFNYRKMKGV